MEAPTLSNLENFLPEKIFDSEFIQTGILEDDLHSTNIDIRQSAHELLEQKLVTMSGKCADNIVNALSIKTFQLNPKAIDEYKRGPGLYDHKFQDGIGCLVDALITPEGPIPHYKLKKIITNISKIGDETAGGNAFNVEVEDESLFVVKTPKSLHESLAHEAFVGLVALNMLRKKIPNFMHTYGVLMCGPPIMLQNPNEIFFCPRKSNAIAYLILENITDAVSLNDIIASLTEEEFLQIYLQIINALNIGKEFEYTHYDMHTGNILIQRLPYKITINFYHPSGTVMYLTTNLLARIIDYGLSYIKWQEEPFGDYGLQYAGVFPERPFYMHDAYKLLLYSCAMSLTIINEQNQRSFKNESTISSLCQDIYRFFDAGSIIDRCKNFGKFENDYFQPEPTAENLTKTHDDLISYLYANKIELISKFIIDHVPSDSVLAACSDDCVTWSEFNHKFFSMNKLPTSFYDYCQTYTAINKLTDSSLSLELKNWLSQVDVEKLFTKEVNSIIGLFELVSDKLGQLVITPYTARFFTRKQQLSEMRVLLTLKEFLTEAKIKILSAECSLSADPGSPERQKLTQISNLYELLISAYSSKLKNLQTNFANSQKKFYKTDFLLYRTLITE
jgi:hypothetical protein